MKKKSVSGMHTSHDCLYRSDWIYNLSLLHRAFGRHLELALDPIRLKRRTNYCFCFQIIHYIVNSPINKTSSHIHTTFALQEGLKKKVIRTAESQSRLPYSTTLRTVMLEADVKADRVAKLLARWPHTTTLATLLLPAARSLTHGQHLHNSIRFYREIIK